MKLLGDVIERTGYPGLAVLHYADVWVYARREHDGWWIVTSIKRLKT